MNNCTIIRLISNHLLFEDFLTLRLCSRNWRRFLSIKIKYDILKISDVKINLNFLKNVFKISNKSIYNLINFNTLNIDNFVNHLSYLKNLKKLKIYRENLLLVEDLSSLKNLTNLESLILSYKRVYKTNKKYKKFFGIRTIPVIPFYSKITDNGISNLENLVNLKLLDISYSKITDNGISYITKLTNLEILRLNYCNLITDNAFVKLKLLYKLRDLSISHLYGFITGNGIYHLKDSNIKYIDISFCNRISHTVFIHFSKLELINISGCGYSLEKLFFLRYNAKLRIYDEKEISAFFHLIFIFLPTTILLVIFNLLLKSLFKGYLMHIFIIFQKIFILCVLLMTSILTNYSFYLFFTYFPKAKICVFFMDIIFLYLTNILFFY